MDNTNKSLMKVKRFLSILKKNQNISLSFYETLMGDPGIPMKVKKMVKKAYAIQAQKKQQGGAINIQGICAANPKSGDIQAKIVKCSNGCVYALCQDGLVLAGYEDVLLKLFSQKIDFEVKKKFITNMNWILSQVNKQDGFQSFIKNTTFLLNNDNILDPYTNETSSQCGYYVRLCAGDVKELFQNTTNPTTNIGLYINHIADLIRQMNTLGIVHGDIKLDNILYRQQSLNTNAELVLHDFDDMFWVPFFQLNNRISSPTGVEHFPVSPVGSPANITSFQIMPAQFTPLYVSPYYLLFRHKLEKTTDKDRIQINKIFFDNISQYIKLLGGLCSLSKQNELYIYIQSIVNKCYEFYGKNDNNDGDISSYLDKASNYINLITKSDIYSWGVSLIVESLKIDDENYKNMLRDKGISYLIEYFSSPFKQPVSQNGGREYCGAFSPLSDLNRRSMPPVIKNMEKSQPKCTEPCEVFKRLEDAYTGTTLTRAEVDNPDIKDIKDIKYRIPHGVLDHLLTPSENPEALTSIQEQYQINETDSPATIEPYKLPYKLPYNPKHTI